MAVAPQKSWTHWLPVMIPYGWLLFFFLVPFLIVAKISLSSTETAIPPYLPVFDPLVDGMSGIWERPNNLRLRTIHGWLKAIFTGVPISQAFGSHSCQRSSRC